MSLLYDFYRKNDSLVFLYPITNNANKQYFNTYRNLDLEALEIPFRIAIFL